VIDIKLIYPRLAAAVNARDLDALDGLILPQIVNHGADPSDPPGAERFKRRFQALIAAFPDFHIAVEDQIAEGDIISSAGPTPARILASSRTPRPPTNLWC
jgi:hypothetical protein